MSFYDEINKLDAVLNDTNRPVARVFTDEDLKAFKSGEMSYTTFEEKTSALIARLEAAERYISSTWGKFPVDIDAADAWNEWRKAAGKEE